MAQRELNQSVMTAARLAVFGVVTVVLAYVSRASLLRPRSHGFYRFLAWDAIVVLFLLNVPAWFRDWSHWHQVISWILLFASFVPLVLGVRKLRGSGKVNYAKRPEGELLAFERTTQLVSDGIYHYIRHPLYCSLLVLTWGVFFKEPGVLGALVAGAATVLLFITAKIDEAECVKVFGADYLQYLGRTKMFIPHVF